MWQMGSYSNCKRNHGKKEMRLRVGEKIERTGRALEKATVPAVHESKTVTNLHSLKR